MTSSLWQVFLHESFEVLYEGHQPAIQFVKMQRSDLLFVRYYTTQDDNEGPMR